MSSWVDDIKCVGCKATEREWGNGWNRKYLLCQPCADRYRDRYRTISRDHDYRKHLAHRVLGIPCMKGCPESPTGHDNLFLSRVVHGYAAHEDEDVELHSRDQDELAVYSWLVSFAQMRFTRPRDEHRIKAFEVVAGHSEVDAIEYCESCLENARHIMETDPNTDESDKFMQVVLCEPCMNMRNTHIQSTYDAKQSESISAQRWRLEDQDLDLDLYYADLLTWRGLAGGSSPFLTKVAFDAFTRYIGVATPVVGSFWAYNQWQHNNSMLDETRRSNAVNESIAKENLALAREQNARAEAELQERKAAASGCIGAAGDEQMEVTMEQSCH